DRGDLRCLAALYHFGLVDVCKHDAHDQGDPQCAPEVLPSEAVGERITQAQRTRTGSAGTVSGSSATASTVSPGSPSSRAQTTRKRPVPSEGLGRTGRPRIVSQPRRSISNGAISTATAG